jgi:hypothetical protein
MGNTHLTDKEGKDLLLEWPMRTRLWPPPEGRGFWIRGQPRDGLRPGPRLLSPGATLFGTQPDGLWVYFNDEHSCDIVAIEVCGNAQNLNDKRSRYMPTGCASVVSATLDWLVEPVALQNSGTSARWIATGSFACEPTADLQLPVRHLRVLYAVPNALYHVWCREHTAAGHEYFCPHSSLATYNAKPMQEFLRRMSRASHFRLQAKSGE